MAKCSFFTSSATIRQLLEVLLISVMKTLTYWGCERKEGDRSKVSRREKEIKERKKGGSGVKVRKK
jgi:hypothetical protein